MTASGLRGAAAVLLFALAGARASEPEAVEKAEAMKRERTRPVPVLSSWLLGGQDFGAGSRPRDSGLASVLAAVSFPLSDRWKLTPLYQGYYQATRQVIDAGGGGVTLFQSRMDHRLGAKLFWEPNERYRFKFNLGSRFQYLKEATNEDWGKGLFDFRKLSGGVEWEYFYRKPHSLRLGYDYFVVTFPNYATLESRGALKINGQTVARELTGGKVLDSASHSFLAGINGSLGRRDWVWDFTYIGSMQRYPEQPLTGPTGQLTADKRRDFLHEFTGSIRGWVKPRWFERLYLGLRATYSRTVSNQNNFNASDNRFFAGYYDSRTLDLLPSMILYFKNPLMPSKAWQLSMSYETILTKYPGRYVQDYAGVYHGRPLSTKTDVTIITVTFPLRQHLNFMTSFRSNVLRSNMKYDALYRYNFSSRSYLLGFGYEL